MKKTLLLCGFAITLLFACQNKSNQTDNQNTGTAATATQQEPTAEGHEAHAEHSTAVKLNNGQKWPANSETTEGIKGMSSLLETLPEEPKTEDYHSLKTKLEKEFGTILQKCTMTGEAHDQLHNYLLPMKEMMEKLGSNSADEQREASNDLKTHLKEYEKYFQ